jgi:hypothetical protein
MEDRDRTAGFDPSDLVHATRAERHQNWVSGRDVVFTPQGRYVADVRVVPFNGSPELEAEFVANPLDDWESFLDNYDIVNTGNTVEPHQDEFVLGSVDMDEVEEKRVNRWCQLDEEDGYRVHVNNLGADVPSTVEVYGGGSIRDIAETAAGYADELAFMDLDEKAVSHQEVRDPRYSSRDMWEDMFIKSLGNAEAYLEDKRREHS